MTPQPLDYERLGDAPERPMISGRWALSLALAAVSMDGIALGAATADGGYGWAFAFP